MIGLIQRVTHAEVKVGNETTAKIAAGLLAFIGIEKEDNRKLGQQLLDRILNFRVFEDETGRMNHSLRDQNGDLLIVPQFTLAANTRSGKRPSFSSAAPPSKALALFQSTLRYAKSVYPQTQGGAFGENMQVELCNNGPATFILTKGSAT